MKCYKKENCETLEIGQVYYNRRFVLTVDRSLCKGCVICKLICPREAISLKPAEVNSKAVAPTVDIDENRCDFHGICAVACPFSAIKIVIDGKETIPAVEKEVFPILTRDIEVDSEKCEPGCKRCEETCPLEIISVNYESEQSKPDIDIKKELCAGCRICWQECPTDAIKVTKFLEGFIQVNEALCPDGCRRCMDVCPLYALHLDDNEKVYANNTNCIYCGACQTVCPAPDALHIERTAVRHTPVVSGAWHKGLEKVTSSKGLMRELAAERTGKMREAIQNVTNTNKEGQHNE